jgi:tetratricopeptide (TPR) repeat protein
VVAERDGDEAWSLLTRGQPEEALARLEALVARLETTMPLEAAFTLAFTRGKLGRAYDMVGLYQRAIPVLEQAVKEWEALVENEREGGDSAEIERGNLAAALGDLANALQNAGRYEGALAAVKRGVAISRELGSHRGVAAGLAQLAQTLMHDGQYAEADAQYDQALHAAEQAGDMELLGSILQHQGMLANEREQYDRSVRLCRRAFHVFQDVHDEGAMMRTCSILGVAEQNAGRPAEARAWY